MRADRLVATLLLLQARGRLTAGEVAAELEVSERTARRDLEALSAAGVPVYSLQGRGGGWTLVGGARTDLSGLTAAETRALFAVAGPGAATPEVKSALRKLVRALPAPFRSAAEAAASAVVVDPAGWGRQVAAPPAYLDALQRAVVDGVQVRLGYAGRDSAPGTRLVHPLGLARKGAVWYLVADTDAGLRTFRVSRVTSVEPTGDRARRPAGFDLAAEWARIVARLDERRAAYDVELTADRAVVGILRGLFGTRFRVRAELPDGRVRATLAASRPELVAYEVAGFGERVHVDGPAEVREQLARIGRELVAAYGPVR